MVLLEPQAKGVWVEQSMAWSREKGGRAKEWAAESGGRGREGGNQLLPWVAMGGW